MVQVAPSARKHDLLDEDIHHAWRNVIRVLVQEYEGDAQMLVVGPDRSGRLLELVAVPSQRPDRIGHADVCRSRFYPRRGRGR